MTDFVTFELAGLPPSPNKGEERYDRARTRRKWRGDAYQVAVDARNRSGLRGFPWPRVNVRYHFYLPDQRRRDWDNLIAAQKPVGDGAREALFVDDSVFGIREFGPHTVSLRRGKPGVRVTIERAPLPEEV